MPTESNLKTYLKIEAQSNF